MYLLRLKVSSSLKAITLILNLATFYNDKIIYVLLLFFHHERGVTFSATVKTTRPCSWKHLQQTLVLKISPINSEYVHLELNIRMAVERKQSPIKL